MSNATDTFVNHRQADPARVFSWPDPEQGNRLIRSFVSIREPTLREAIIKLVAELSAPDDEKKSLQRITEFSSRAAMDTV